MNDQYLRNSLRPFVATGVLAVSAAALAGGGHEGGHGGDGHGHEGGLSFGAPADPSEADRTIEVVADDQMNFSPASVEAAPGETIRFVVENVGSMQHSFTLGTPEGQEAHEQEMQGMPMEEMAGHMNSEPNGMVLQGGETKTLTWRFAEGVPVEFACHIPGHYAAGMKGKVALK